MQISSSRLSSGRHQRGVFMGSYESLSLSEVLSLSDIDPRAPTVTVDYTGKRSSEELDSIVNEINSYSEGETYILDSIP